MEKMEGLDLVETWVDNFMLPSFDITKVLIEDTDELKLTKFKAKFRDLNI
jgi:hypothetical protein